MLAVLLAEVLVVAVKDVRPHVQVKGVLKPPLVLNVQTQRGEELFRFPEIGVLLFERLDLVAENPADRSLQHLRNLRRAALQLVTENVVELVGVLLLTDIDRLSIKLEGSDEA